MTIPPLARRLLAELLGSAFLAAVVIGSGIAAQQLSPHDTGFELLENAAAAAGLYTIILMFGPVSAGTSTPSSHSSMRASAVQLAGRACLPTCPDHRLRAWGGRREGHVRQSRDQHSAHHRASPAHLLAEIIATLGLLLVIFSLARSHRGPSARAAVGTYVGACPRGRRR